MIMKYDFSCVKPGCKAHVHVTLYVHDNHACDIEQLGRAIGFQPVVENSFMPRWQCISHAAKAEGTL